VEAEEETCEVGEGEALGGSASKVEIISKNSEKSALQ